jgi:hypothetical protein
MKWRGWAGLGWALDMGWSLFEVEAGREQGGGRFASGEGPGGFFFLGLGGMDGGDGIGLDGIGLDWIGLDWIGARKRVQAAALAR